MALIDTEYFTGDLFIPKMDYPEVSERLEPFIEKYEEKFLLNLLGYELQELNDADLINGVVYTDAAGRSYKWKGLLIASDPPQSPIANYVYFHWMRNETTDSSGVGEVINKTDNATRTNSVDKQRKAWNEMVDMLRPMRHFLQTNRITYPMWRITLDNYEFFQYIPFI